MECENEIVDSNAHDENDSISTEIVKKEKGKDGNIRKNDADLNNDKQVK